MSAAKTRTPPLPFTQRRRRRSARAWPFTVVGLTGSIAMGKSTTANMLRRFGWPVFDADAAVHLLMAHGGEALPQIAEAFAGVVGPTGVDRQALGAAVFGNPAALQRLEGIIHPLVRAARRRFLLTAASRRAPVVVLDIPLLFETGNTQDVDIVVVATAPAFLQRQRALARTGMTPERLKGILARQLTDHTKRRHAHIVVPTGLGKREALRRLGALRHLTARRPAEDSQFASDHS